MRIEATVTMKGIYKYEAPAYTGYGYDTHYIYNMVAEDGTVYVWKTTTFMSLRYEAENGCEIDAKGRSWDYSPINRGDVVTIKATVKGDGEYKGQKQTELTRVKVVSRQFKAETTEEREARKAREREERVQAQRDSLKDGDQIWRMPYRQYKNHYADCETIEGSYRESRYRGESTIEVIIRAGRMKPSGVRGEQYNGYRLQNADGEQVVYRAVAEKNAIRRAEKELGGAWECIKIYRYNDYHRWF